MTMPREIAGREYTKFVEVSGETSVRVKDFDAVALLTAIASSLGATGIVVSLYSDSQIVPSSTTAEIYSYTIPTGKVLELNSIFISGENIASYVVRKNSIKIADSHTYFGASLDSNIQFGLLKFVADDIISIDVINFRQSVGNFSARIVGVLSNA